MENYQDYSLNANVNGVEIGITVRGNITDPRTVLQSIIQMAVGMTNAVARPTVQLPTTYIPYPIVHPVQRSAPMPAPPAGEEEEEEDEGYESEEELIELPRPGYISPAPSVYSDEESEEEEYSRPVKRRK